MSEMPICLVGLRPFMGAKKSLVASNTYLVLMTSSEDMAAAATASGDDEAKPKWTIYSLSLPTPLALYKDMVQLAEMNKTLSKQGYLQLLSEAHIVLRTACHQLSWQLAVNNKDATKEIEDQLRPTRESYMESCFMLGNFYALSENDYKLTLPYYRMSCKPLLQVLQKAKEAWLAERPNDKSLPAGLNHYVNEIILRPVDGEDILETSLADMIIDLLGQYAPNSLAAIVLKSQSFRQFKTTKIHGYLKKLLKDAEAAPRSSKNGSGDESGDDGDNNAAHVLAFTVLSVEQGCDLEDARLFLQNLSPVQLSEVALEYHGFLVEAAGTEQGLSEVAMLLRDAVPGTFVEILVSLIKSDVYTLPMVLHLLIGSLVSMSSMSGAGTNVANDAAILQLFLEAYFTDVIQTEAAANEENNCNNDDAATIAPAILLDGDQLQALHCLVRSYLTSLSVPVRFGEKNIDCNMFGNRLYYLDLLPPFNCKNAKDVLMGADSPDFWCQNSLLKLQSLLCSNLCKGQSCKSIVLGYFDLKPDTIGGLSLKVLCLVEDPKAVVDLLVENNPDVLLPFGKEHKVDMETWKIMLRSLQDHMNKDKDDKKNEAWYTAMQEILDYLAQALVLDAFLEILPGPANNEDFQGYIQLCRKNQQAHQIQNLIVNTGHKLLSTLTF